MSGTLDSPDTLDIEKPVKKRFSDSLHVDWLSRNSYVNGTPEAQVEELKKTGDMGKQAPKAKGPVPEGNSNSRRRSDADDTLESRVLGPNRILRERRRSVSSQNEFGVAPSYSALNPYDTGTTIRRTKSLSMNSNGHIEEPKREKGGFFRSLFGRRKKDDSKSTNTNTKPALRRSSFSAPIKEVEPPNPPRSAPANIGEDSVSVTRDGANMPPVRRSKTAPISTENVEVRLDEFLQHCREHPLDLDSKKSSSSRATRTSKPGIPRHKATFSIDDNLSPTEPSSETQTHFDAKGRPIPPHPSKSDLLPALKRSERTQHHKGKLKRTNTNTSSTTNKFGAFLKRVTSHTEEHSHSSKQSLTDSESDSSDEDLPQISEDQRPAFIPGLEDIKPLKKVSFATNTYFNDPPQQICSKNPRKGEVEVKSDGSVIIHRLTPEEKREILQKTSSGIVVGGSGHLKLLSDPSVSEEEAKRNEEKKPSVPKEDGSQVLNNEEDVGRGGQGGDSVAHENNQDTEEDVKVSKSASEVTIDKPMVSRRSMSSLGSSITVNEVEEETPFPPTNMKIPHDIVYTRCCHLREILPIPATLKQLKKGSTDPIPLLQMRNPKPSLIEVLSFSDFLSISPVLCLSLDGVNLSIKMLKTILCSLMHKKEFEKLTLRNTPLDHEGWRILCYFVSQCKSLNSLDLTMVPGIAINVQKPSKSSLKSRDIRMTCDMNDRKNMNWNLLAASLVSGNGLEEIIASGAKMPLKEFKNFIELGCAHTQRLGLAYNELSLDQCCVLAEWLAQSKVTGIDIGFNDLRGKLGPFSATVINKMRQTKNIFKYISLNCTNLEVSENSSSENSDVLKLISVLSYCEDLKLLDISNNPKLFPHVTNHLTNYLPVFVNLIRLHMDNNSIPSTSIVEIAEVLPTCQKLTHVSMRGSKLDYASGCALVAAMRKSSSLLTLDLDCDNLPNKIRDKISLYSMKNMEAALNKVDKSTSPEMSDTLACLQKELSDLLTEKPVKQEEIQVAAQSFLHRLSRARSFINKVTEDLFKLRVEGNLSTEGKDTLIRFCFIDATFERGLKLLAQRYSNLSFSSGSLCANSKTGTDAGPEMRASGLPLKKETSSATLSSKHFSDSGHAALLPFHYPPIESSDPADDEVEIKWDSPDTEDQHARDQLREEGRILRGTRGIMGRVQSASNQGTSDDRECHITLDQKALRKAASELDSEQIKEFILSNDISSVAGVLEDLKSRGISLNDIFKKRHDRSDSNNQASVGCEKSSNSDNAVVGVQANLEEEKQRLANSGPALDSESSSEDEREGEAIDRVYDEVLDNIQRVRTNTES
ncbi:Mhp1p [Lachancea thermotolerans]